MKIIPPELVQERAELGRKRVERYSEALGILVLDGLLVTTAVESGSPVGAFCALSGGVLAFIGVGMSGVHAGEDARYIDAQIRNIPDQHTPHSGE